MKPNPYLVKNSRTETLLGKKSKISEKSVTIIGLGGGSEIALHLLRSGVTKMNLIDMDILESHNLVRHICGIEYVGQNKAKAVKNLLDKYSGNITSKIKAFDSDIFKIQKEFEKMISNSDLIIVATDNDSSKFFINELTVEYGKPAVYVGMYENGIGGEVFTQRKGLACYECFSLHSERHDYVTKYEAAKEKRDCSSERDTKALPGLGIDQAFLSAISSRKSLDILLEDSEDLILSPIGKNWIIWSLTGIKNALESNLSSLHYDFPIHKDCRLHK